MAVDGDASTRSETMIDSIPWLTVDLLDQYIVQEVVVTTGSNLSGTLRFVTAQTLFLLDFYGQRLQK